MKYYSDSKSWWIIYFLGEFLFIGTPLLGRITWTEKLESSMVVLVVGTCLLFFCIKFNYIEFTSDNRIISRHMGVRDEAKISEIEGIYSSKLYMSGMPLDQYSFDYKDKTGQQRKVYFVANMYDKQIVQKILDELKRRNPNIKGPIKRSSDDINGAAAHWAERQKDK